MGMTVLPLSGNNKRLKGWGLVEILISMTIFGIAIIGITALNVKNLKTVRENELADQANKVMIAGLEYFKSPPQEVQELLMDTIKDDVEAADFVLNDETKTVDFSQGTRKYGFVSSLTFPDKIEPTKIPEGKCTKGGAGEVIFAGSDFRMCMHVLINKQSYGFQVVSSIIYFAESEWHTNSIVGYRPFTYEDTTPTPTSP